MKGLIIIFFSFNVLFSQELKINSDISTKLSIEKIDSLSKLINNFNQELIKNENGIMSTLDTELVINTRKLKEHIVTPQSLNYFNEILNKHRSNRFELTKIEFGNIEYKDSIIAIDFLYKKHTSLFYDICYRIFGGSCGNSIKYSYEYIEDEIFLVDIGICEGMDPSVLYE